MPVTTNCCQFIANLLDASATVFALLAMKQDVRAGYVTAYDLHTDVREDWINAEYEHKKRHILSQLLQPQSPNVVHIYPPYVYVSGVQRPCCFKLKSPAGRESFSIKLAS